MSVNIKVNQKMWALVSNSSDENGAAHVTVWGVYTTEEKAYAEEEKHLSEGLYDAEELAVVETEVDYEHTVDPDLVD